MDNRSRSSILKPALRQLVLFVAATVLAFIILLQTDLVSRFAYRIEKGRIEALRESMPSPAEVSAWNAQARTVAAAVAPAVVQVVTERSVSMEEAAAQMRRFFGPRGESEAGTSGLDAPDAGSSGVEVPDDEVHRGLDGDRGIRLRTGYGSGFVVEADKGHLITNHHVIADADRILVYLPDGRRFEAELVGADAKSDLALLKIEADRLHALPLADSDQVEVGDDVMAVGNPFGLDGTFSRGIISAKGRSQIRIEGVEYQGFLQTDAVINPGNSGGPLVNLRGEVVAINTAIATSSGHYDGVGFAIPARRVQQLLPSLEAGVRPVRGYLGVSIVSVEIAEERAAELGWKEYHGVLVEEVLPGTPAETGGLRREDIVLRIGETKLRTTADLIDTVSATTPDTTLDFAVWRDGAEIKLPIRIGTQPVDFTHRRRRH